MSITPVTDQAQAFSAPAVSNIQIAPNAVSKDVSANEANEASAPNEAVSPNPEKELKESAAGKLGLDWKLFVAQLFNFGIIFLVLWKWVFKPIAQHLEERTTKIENSLKDAEDIELQKGAFDAWKAEETRKAHMEAGEILKKALQDAEQIVQESKVRAKQEQAKILETGKEQLELERNEVLTSLKGEMAEMITLGVSKVLGEKLDSKKDKLLLDKAVEQINKTKNL